MLVSHDALGIIQKYKSVIHMFDNFGERGVLHMGEFQQVSIEIDDLDTDGKIIKLFVDFAIHFKAAHARMSSASNRTIPKVSQIVDRAVRVDYEMRANLA